MGLAVALRVPGHAVQVFEHARDQQLLHAGRAGKLFDGFIQFGKQAVAQLAQVRGARLGLAPLLVGHPGLPHDAGNARHQGGGQQRRSRQAEPVAADELAGSIAERAAARRNRQPLEIGAKIGGKLLGGEIALLGFLAQSLQQDRFQIGIEPLAGSLPLAPACEEVLRRSRAASLPW